MNVPPYWHTCKRNTCCDVISRGLFHARTYPAATWKRCGWFMFISISYNVRANACARITLRITVDTYNYKAACTSSKYAIKITIKWTHWHSSIFYSSKFSQPWFVNIFYHQNFAPYGINQMKPLSLDINIGETVLIFNKLVKGHLILVYNSFV